MMSFFAFGQRQDANWVFGYNCGLNFSNANPTSYYIPINSFEPSASISDNNGTLLFYVRPSNPQSFVSDFSICSSDGIPILNGDSIKLHTSATNGAIFLEIIQDSLYFLIHTGSAMAACDNLGFECYRLYLTKIEKRNIGWTVIDKNLLLTTKLVTEKLAVVLHANGIDWWVLTQAHTANEDSLCTNEYLSFLVGSDFISANSQHLGRTWCSQASYAGEMIFSGNGNKVAVANYEDYYIRCFDFDRCIGQLSRYTESPFHNIGKPYSIEFSRNEQVLYVSYGGGSPTQGLVQISLYNGQTSQAIIWDYSFQGLLGQLQLAPDGKIYLSSALGNYFVDDTVNKYLTVINFTDSIGFGCGLSALSIFVGDSCRTLVGLPNMPNYNLGPLPVYMADAGKDTFYCAGDSEIKAFPIGGDSIYGITYQWLPAPGINTLNARTQLVLPPPQSRWYYVNLTDTNYVGPSCNSRLDSVYIEVRNCDTVGILETANLQAKLYPNPTTGTLTIELPSGQEGSIELYNLLGQSVFNATINGTTTLQTELPQGVYIYQITQGGKSKMGRLIVE